MTEAEWLRCTEPRDMLRAVRDKVSQRKLRLYVCACARLSGWPFLLRGAIEIVQAAETAVDGDCEMSQVDEMVHDLLTQHQNPDDVEIAVAHLPVLLSVPDAYFSASTALGLILPRGLNQLAPQRCVNAIRCLAGHLFPKATRKPAPTRSSWLARAATGLVNLVASSPLRQPFGNVQAERPAPFPAPSWLTSTVVAVARQMYESRSFDAMPILADALQDAGCDNEDALAHCRDANATHVRGCWVIDGVLGRS